MKPSRRVAIGVLLVVLGVPAACGGPSGRDDLDDLASAANFTNGRDATGALATISGQLLTETNRCITTKGRDDVECGTLGVMVAWTQAAAVDVGRCSRAGAEEARSTLLQLLRARAAARRGRLDAPPRVPPTPDCR